MHQFRNVCVARRRGEGNEKQIPHCVRDDIGKGRGTKSGPPRKAGPLTLDQAPGGGGQPGNSRSAVFPIY